MFEKPTYKELEKRIQLLEQTEKALIESEQKWRNILVNIPQIGIALDPQARIVSAYGIIKNHGGIITVSNNRNHGTTFDIYLQISEKEIQQEVATDGTMVKGSGTILLVDDEDMIINVGQALLERLGYKVIAVKSGEAAAEDVLRMGSGIDLVILDMIMPGMDGGKTFDRIREIHPQMPVLLSSGYAVNGQATEILRRGCNGFIQKPFNIAKLSQKIRNILEAAEDGS
jgi:CheY-like chemotaxis protein